MKILKLTVKNFRSFTEQTFEFNGQFNILIGDNATGKTSILDALSIAMSSFLKGFEGIASSKYSYIVDSDVSYIFEESGGRIFRRSKYPSEIFVQGLVDNESIEWRRIKEVGKKSEGMFTANNIYESAVKMQNKIKNGQGDIHLPLLRYFNAKRLCNSLSSDTSGEDIQETISHSRESYAYEDVLGYTINNQKIFYWLQKNQRIAQQKGLNKQLVGVKKAMISMIDECEDVFYDEEYEGFVVRFKNDEILLFSSLSDGQRNLLGLAADIAYRMALLNPWLEERICETSGIVLIDELDLHLHPKWQREIVGKLKAAFPNIQFIVTTHSPQIIGEAQPEYLRILSRDDNGEIQITTPKQSLGLDSAEILEEIMGGVPRRNKDVSLRLESIARMIDNEEFDSARAKIEELKTELSGSIPEIVRLEGLITMLED